MEPQVLIVCEEMLARKATVTLLQKAGLAVCEAYDARSAVDVLNEGGIGAVVVTWTSQQADFPPICETMRAMQGFAHIACVVVSEHRNSEDVLTAVEAGADDFLASPATGPRLAERVRLAFELTKRRGAEASRSRIRHLYVDR
jgi:DNA-binding response OmpR family regulator